MISQNQIPLTVLELYKLQLITYVSNNADKFKISISTSRTRLGGTNKAEIPFIYKSRIRRQALYAGPIAYNSLPRNLKFDLINYKRRRRKLLMSFIQQLPTLH